MLLIWFLYYFAIIIYFCKMGEKYMFILHYDEDISLLRVRSLFWSLGIIFVLGSSNCFVNTAFKIFIFDIKEDSMYEFAPAFRYFCLITTWFEIAIPLIFGIFIIYVINYISMFE